MTESGRTALKVLVTCFYSVFGIVMLVAGYGGVSKAIEVISKGGLPDVVGGIVGLIVCLSIFGWYAYWSALRIVTIWRE